MRERESFSSWLKSNYKITQRTRTTNQEAVCGWGVEGGDDAPPPPSRGYESESFCVYVHLIRIISSVIHSLFLFFFYFLFEYIWFFLLSFSLILKYNKCRARERNKKYNLILFIVCLHLGFFFLLRLLYCYCYASLEELSRLFYLLWSIPSNNNKSE